MASPFKRKPVLVRTYGSSSSSAPSAAAPPSSRQPSALDRLLADSSSDEERSSLEPRQAQTSKRAATASAAAKGKEPVRSRRSTSAAAPLDKDQSRWDEKHATRTRATRRISSRGTASVDPLPTRTKSSGSQLPQRTSLRKRAAQAPVDHEQLGEDSAEDEILSRPSPPRRKVKRTDSSSHPPAGSPSSTGKSSTTSSISLADTAKSQTAPPKGRKLGKPVDADDDDDSDEIPAPTTFVPLAERLKQASQVSRDGSSATQPRAEERTPPPPSPSSPKRPRPRKAATAPTPTRAALSSPRLPADGDSDGDDKDQKSRPSAPAPASPAKPTPGAAIRRSAAASPVKDLSAVFSRFATSRTSVPPSPPPPSNATGGGSSSSNGVVVQQHEDRSLLNDADSAARAPVGGRPTVGLKRARSLVGGMAGPIAKRLGGGTRSPEPEADDPDGDDDRDGRLGRTYSQPGSSVLSPSRPNSHRPPLGTSLSVPAILSPTKSSPVRGTSPAITATTSPFRRPQSPGVGPLGGGNGLAALLGGGGGGAGVMTADGNGPTRTYASGRRTVRTPVESEEAGDQATTSRTTTTTTTRSKMLAAVPGSSHPQSAESSAPHAASSMVAAPPPPRRETYASLRLLWGIDAEENLDADEDQDSQDRGAKVVGSGTLRKQGEGKRWMDELGWMCDGLRAGGGGGEGGGDRGAARASAIELVGKALEKDWVRRLKSSGQAETVYLALRTATSSGGASNAPPRTTTTTMTADRVLDVAIAVTLALFVKDQRLVEPLLRISSADVQRNAAAHKTTPPSSPDDPQHEQDGNSDLLEVLTALLDREWASDEIGTSAAAAAGPTQAGGISGRNRVSKVLKSDTRHLQALRDLIDKSSLFSADDAAALPVSIRSLVLLTIRSIAFFAPRPIFQPQSMLCSAGVLERVVWDFEVECAGLQARISKYEEGLDLIAPPPAQPQVSIPILSLHLSIFEATSLAGPLAFELISSPELLPPLSLAFTQLAHVAVLLALDRNPGPPPPPTTMSRVPIASEDALRTLVAVLGILLALSSDERWSVAFVEAELLPTLVRAALLSRRLAGEGVPGSAPQAAAEEAPQSSLSDAVDPATSDATTTTGSEAEEVATAAAAVVDDHGRSRLIWDVLSLSVGVLANVLDAAPESLVGDSLLELWVNPACRGRRKCAWACRCSNDDQETALAALCRLAIDPLDDAVDSVYRASVHGFLRLALGLSLLASEAAESAITDALEAHPAVLGYVLDALEGFASLYDEREQARRSLRLALPPAARLAQDSGASGSRGRRDLDADQEEEEPTQVDLDETLLDEEEGDGERVEAGDADSERIIRMREVVQRLRRRVR